MACIPSVTGLGSSTGSSPCGSDTAVLATSVAAAKNHCECWAYFHCATTSSVTGCSCFPWTVDDIHINVSVFDKFHLGSKTRKSTIFMVAEQNSDIHGNDNDGYGGEEELGGP